MGKLDRLLDDIERMANDGKSVMSRKVYSDAPLVFTASQMKSFTPDRIMRFRREFRTRSVYTSDPLMFLRQAQFMEDYEDDYIESAVFSSAFPSYAAMNDSQLRTYFSWRTKLRRGELEKTSLAYAYVYIFELLNLVGADSPTDAFIRLCTFFESYGKLDKTVLLYRARWLTDFAVYYGLEQFYSDLPSDDTVCKNGAVLAEPDKYSDRSVFLAAECFSSYSISRSASYKAAPKLCERVVSAVIREGGRYFGAGGMAARFCKRRKASYFLFASAIVYSNVKPSRRTVKLPDGREFCEINGNWLLISYVKDSALSREFGVLMRFIDNIICSKLKTKNKMRPAEPNIEIRAAVERCINGVFDGIRHENIKKRMDSVKIDVFNLDAIRRSSDETGVRLLTEEDICADIGKIGLDGAVNAESDALSAKSSEIDLNNAHMRIPKAACVGSANGSIAGSPMPDGIFSDGAASEEISRNAVPKADSGEKDGDIAARVLRILLDGGDASVTVKSSGVTLSMICDEINERFYEEFCDTVIDFDDETPYVLPDYAEELRGMLE